MGHILTRIPSSSNPVNSYAIIRGGDGVVYCECTAWKMNKDCKHLRQFLGQSVSENKAKELRKVDMALDMALATNKPDMATKTLAEQLNGILMEAK